MPDFNIKDAHNIQTIELNISGWKPIRVLFGVYRISEKIYYLWQVENTTHTFAIDTDFIYTYHGGDIREHFVETLKKFRTDLMEWRSQGLPEEWMKRYNYDFFGLVVK